MAIGRKTGGRKKGVPNKRTADVQNRLAASGLMPLDFMVQVLRDENQSFERRQWAAKESAPYIHPKLANVEIGNKDGKPFQLISASTDKSLI